MFMIPLAAQYPEYLLRNIPNISRLAIQPQEGRRTFVGARSPRGTRRAGAISLAFQPEGYGPVVDEADLHVSAEFARFNAVEAFPASIDQVLKVLAAHIWRRCARKAGAGALFRIGGQRELRYEQQRAIFVADATVHAAFCVRKHAVALYALREPADVFGRVIAVYGDQHQQTRPDFANNAAADADRGLANALQQTNQMLANIFGPILQFSR